MQFSPEIPPLRLQLAGSARRVHRRRRITVQHLHYRLEDSRGYQASGDAWSPGYFRVDLERRRQRVTVIASTESVETMTALAPDEARAAELERRRRLLLVGRSRARRSRDGRARARGRSIRHHAGGPCRGCRAGPRRRRRSAHRHRRLSLVHGLGPRHDDQPRRADAYHRAASTKRATSCARLRSTSATA